MELSTKGSNFAFQSLNMDTIQQQETLADYKEIFEEYVTGKDIVKVGLDNNIAKSTIYTFLNGGVPNNNKSRETEQVILSSLKKILGDRGEVLVKNFKPSILND